MTYLDSYCERAGQAHIWAEPINAISNIAFLIAAAIAIKMIKRYSVQARDIKMLPVILVLIGLGSFAWHVMADEFTLMLDVIPITIFINLYIIIFLTRCMQWRWWGVVAAFVMLQLMNAAVSYWLDADTLYGTIMYLPTYIMLLGFSILAFIQKKTFALHLCLITCIWTCSLIFRTIDLPICYATHVGTHFLWHIANAVTLYELIKLTVYHHSRRLL